MYNSHLLNLVPALPECLLFVLTCTILLYSAFSRKPGSVPYFLSQIALLVTVVALYRVFQSFDMGLKSVSFYGMFVLDKMALLLKVVIAIVVFFTLVYSRQYNTSRQLPSGEFYVLVLLSTLGMMVMVSANHLLTLYLGLELFALPTYALVALQRSKALAIESSLKLFVMSAVASGLLLYGYSFIFGATQSMSITGVATALATNPPSMMSVFGVVLIVSALAFKLGTVPFQMWIPDVYEGAPTATTLYLAAAPKVAAFAMMIRLLTQALPALVVDWQWVLTAISLLSMLVGNLAAIMQTNIKRMLAYSSISHMGFMLLGFISGSADGYAASLFYVVSYAVMTSAAFGVIILLNQGDKRFETLDDFKGLSSRHPGLALVMLLSLFSMAGVPPLLGFIAKVHILEALFVAHYAWLVVVALIFSVVGVYYYLRVIQRMYFDSVEGQYSVALHCDSLMAVYANGLLVLMMGIFPNALFTWAQQSFGLL